MLLSFACDNFKSFSNGFEFSMTPEKRMTELSYSLLNECINKEEVGALSASVIYGHNAAGKTSVINAMSCLRRVVARGTIKDEAEDRSGDHVSSAMTMAPFAFRDEAKPVSFDISFTYNRNKYKYRLSIYLGRFLEKRIDRYIENEQLFVNDSLVYTRSKNSVDYLDLKSILTYLNSGFEDIESDKIQQMMSNNISYESLLLTTDFNSFCSKRIVSDIVEWFASHFLVVNSADRTRFLPTLPDNEGQALINTYINRIAQEAGIIGSDFAYVSDPETHRTKLFSVLKKNDERIYGLEADRIESIGTMRLVSIMPAIIAALRRGAALIMDELDTSLHPMMVMNIISIFHNDSVNRRGAQLIFNTHNPIYLNHDLLRRDEIKFVERDKKTKSSSLYALSDFKANGTASVRKTSDYMKNYFINRYGAIEDVDFTDIIAEILREAITDGEN